jgi:hypothetical protein
MYSDSQNELAKPFVAATDDHHREQLLRLIVRELAQDQGLRPPNNISLPPITVDYLLRLLVHPFTTPPDHPALRLSLESKDFQLYMRCRQVSNLRDKPEAFLNAYSSYRSILQSTLDSVSIVPYRLGRV